MKERVREGEREEGESGVSQVLSMSVSLRAHVPIQHTVPIIMYVNLILVLL